MGKTRLEAFSDGVIAILITIMVLELKIPNGNQLADFQPLVPILLSYVFSFIYLGIYWNNHHHMIHTCSNVTGGILWANLHLLFWLSLVPFTTGWMGESEFSSIPTFFYGANLLLAAISYYILQIRIVKTQGKDSVLKRAIGNDFKGKISPVLYAIGLALNFLNPLYSLAIYGLVAFIWLIPDKRIERYYK